MSAAEGNSQLTMGRRISVSTRGSSEPNSDQKSPAHLSHLQRRMSRMDTGMGSMYRRMSMFRRPSMAPSLRTSESNSRKPTQLENTYRLGPEEGEKFSSSRVTKTVSDILSSYLEGEQYEPKKCQKMVQSLTDVIKARIREMHFSRYKIVCHVILGQDADQCMQYCSRCVWSKETDNYASASYTNGDIYAVATVYGIYFE